MHMLFVVTGGLLLCGIFALFGKHWGGDMMGIDSPASAEAHDHEA